MSERTGSGQSGGVTISGSIGLVRGDIVGRDKITSSMSATAIEEALEPVREAVASAPEEKAEQAATILAELKQEATKGDGASDAAVAKLVDGLVALLPGPASAVVGAFATPILGGLAGPVTNFVLNKLRGG
jgi:hypothetical protein